MKIQSYHARTEQDHHREDAPTLQGPPQKHHQLAGQASNKISKITRNFIKWPNSTNMDISHFIP